MNLSEVDKTSDLLNDGLIDEFEAPVIALQSLDGQEVETGQVLESAEFNVEPDFVTRVDRVFAV